MAEEKKVTLEDLEDLLEEESGGSSQFSFQNIFAMLVLHWNWFLLSLIICVCGALIYLRYATPVYQVSAKMLIKDEDSRRRSSNQILSNMQEFGFMSNSAGIENEMEILQSRILARDAVKDLKLYVQYRSSGSLKKNRPAIRLPLLSMPRIATLSTASFVDWKRGKQYEVKGETMLNGKPTSDFSMELASLPGIVKTDYGVLTLMQNGKKEMKDGDKYLVNILPPMVVATQYAKAINIAPTSKMTSIAELTLTDQNVRRGLDYLYQLAECYNRQANTDKNEIALKTEEFINSRLEKIDAELGSTEDKLENYKKRNAVTQLNMDASQSLAQSTQYETKLTEVNSQIQLMDYLREFVDNPANQYKIIPSNVGMTDHASTALITSYNSTVQERNRYLKTNSL